MARRALFWSVVSFASLAVACGASPPPPAPAPAPAPTASASATAPAHAPAPPAPPGVETASIDTSVSPCDDFFQYACGRWIKTHPIPSDEASWTRFNVLADGNVRDLRDILERDATNPPADEAYAKVLGDYYGACIDEAGVEKDGLKALQPELARIAGVSDVAGLSREVARLHAMGVYPYFFLRSQQDFKDAAQMIAVIDQRGLGLPDREYYLRDDAGILALRDKYLAHVESVFTLLGDKPVEAKKEAQAVYAYEKALAADQISHVEHRDMLKTYHRMTPAELVKLAGGFKWDIYFKELGAPTMTAINVRVPDYLAALAKHLTGATKDTWASEVRPYLRFTLERAYAESLPKRFVDEANAFRKELTGQEKEIPRWRRCVAAVDEAMGEALAIPFVKDKLGAEGKQAALTEVKAIEAAMQADLQQAGWMDDATRAHAIDKLHKVANVIGFPDKWRNYDALKIDRKSSLGNAIRAAQFETRRDLATVGKPVDRSDWGISPPTLNGYYAPTLNQMVFPAGILQQPFFSVARPQAVNIGGIGVVMGHELTHGFDDQGRKLDGDGNLVDSWTPPVAVEFDKRAVCVADQFDAYVAVEDARVNGKLTLGENLADLGGLKLGLSALRAAGPPSPEADRQFFIGYAQVWCGERRPETTKMLGQVDPHSPPRWRVDGPLSNMPEFASAFSCQAGDAMVRPPENRCTVW